MLLAILLVLAPSVPATSALTWSGKASTIEVSTVNGSVTVRRSADADIHLLGRGSSVDPKEHLRVLERGRGIVVCEIYPSDLATDASCPGRGDQLGIPARPQRVDVEVAVPADVSVRLTTVNGSVVATLSALSVIETVNGNIRVVTSARSRLTSINGDVTFTATRPAWSGETAITTTNGKVSIDLPAGFYPAIEAESASRVFKGRGESRVTISPLAGSATMIVNATSGPIVIRRDGRSIAETN